MNCYLEKNPTLATAQEHNLHLHFNPSNTEKIMKKQSILILLFITFTGLSGFRNHKPESVNIIVIVNKDNPVTKLTAGEVKLYWLRKIKKRWPELNKNIKPVDRKSACPEQETFYSKVLNMTATDVETYFSQKQYESAEKPQDKFSTDAAIVDFVSEEPGAIGYVNANANISSANVKVVLAIP